MQSAAMVTLGVRPVLFLQGIELGLHSICYFRSMFDHLVYPVNEYDSQLCGVQQKGDSPAVLQIVGLGHDELVA